MTDAIAIAADLPFRAQVLEFVQHLSRSASNPSDTTTKEFVSQWDSQIDASAEVPEEQRRTLVKSIVDKVAELRGAIEGVRDTDAEGAHLLLQNLLSSTFDVESEEYRELNKKVVEAVKKAGEGAWSAKRIIRHETASRVLNNTYNILPSSSPLRPTVLLALISLLSLSGDLKTLSLTPLSLTISLSQWAISPQEKLEFLTSASAIYAGARESHRALELQIIAIEQLQAGKDAVEKAVVYALSDDKRFSVDDVLRVQGVKEKVEGKTAELVKLFEGDALEGVKKGQEWVGANSSWIEGFSVPQFTAEAIVQKLRFIALVALAAQSSNQQLSFADIASGLAIDLSEVELYVIDAIRENLLKARISQPTASIRILSVSSVATRQFGSSEWQLLEKRLNEWKKAVTDVQAVIVDAEALAAQGPATNRPNNRQQGERGPRKDRREQGGQSQQQANGDAGRESAGQDGVTA